MKKLVILMTIPLLLAACTPENGTGRIEELISEMTLEEKIGQLNQYTGRWEMTGPAPDNDWAQAGLQSTRSQSMQWRPGRG